MGDCIVCKKKTNRKLPALWGRGIHADLKKPVLVCNRECELLITKIIKAIFD